MSLDRLPTPDALARSLDTVHRFELEARILALPEGRARVFWAAIRERESIAPADLYREFGDIGNLGALARRINTRLELAGYPARVVSRFAEKSWSWRLETVERQRASRPTGKAAPTRRSA